MAMSSANRSIVASRLVTGAIFFCAGFGKVTGTFVKSDFARAASDMARDGYPFWRPFLARVVVPHPTPFAWAVAAGELAIGLSLLSGLLVRWASIAGVLLMISIGLGACWPPAGSPWHLYVAMWLTQAACAMLFLIFASSDAGRTFGLDARRGRGKTRPPR